MPFPMWLRAALPLVRTTLACLGATIGVLTDHSQTAHIPAWGPPGPVC